MPVTEYVGYRGRVIRPEQFTQAVRSGLQEAAYEAEVRYRNTVRTWNRKPDFSTTRLREYELVVGTDNEIYGYVNHGTEPHVIAPRDPGGTLAFQSGYQAKTVPNVAFSRSGGAFGEYVHAKEVQHPGTEPRNFDQTIADQLQSLMPGIMQSAMQRAVRV